MRNLVPDTFSFSWCSETLMVHHIFKTKLFYRLTYGFMDKEKKCKLNWSVMYYVAICGTNFFYVALFQSN